MNCAHMVIFLVSLLLKFSMYLQEVENAYEGMGAKKSDSGKTLLKVVGGIAVLGLAVLIVILPIYFEVIGGLPLGRYGTLRLRRRSIFAKLDAQVGNGKSRFGDSKYVRTTLMRCILGKR